jgi:sugar phosphate isomerase/epimerase
MWGACLHREDLLTRAECLRPAGFDAMTAFVTDVAAAERRLGSLDAVRRELAARDAPVNCVDVYLGWYPGHDPSAIEGAASDLLRATEDEMLRHADGLGAEYVSIAAPFWGEPAPLEQVADALGGFTDRAAARGVRPHLEISNGSHVSTVAAAVELLAAVGRSELGLVLDTYNISRAGGSPADVDVVPLEAVFQIQLVDGAREPVRDRFYDSLHHRELPGEGELPVAEFVRRLAAKGPLPPIGPEVFNDALVAMPAGVAARRCAEVTRRFLRDVVPGPPRPAV